MKRLPKYCTVYLSIDLFGTLTGKISLWRHHFCTLVFESCETKLCEVGRHDQTNKLAGDILINNTLFEYY